MLLKDKGYLVDEEKKEIRFGLPSAISDSSFSITHRSNIAAIRVLPDPTPRVSRFPLPSRSHLPRTCVEDGDGVLQLGSLKEFRLILAGLCR